MSRTRTRHLVERRRLARGRNQAGWTGRCHCCTPHPESLEVRALPSVTNLQTVTIAPAEGEVFSGKFATFNDTALNAGTYSVNIDYGDGSNGIGLVQPSPAGSPGQFDVLASHSYAEDGLYPLTVVVSDLADTPVTSASVSAPVVVFDAPLSRQSVGTVNTVEGRSFTAQLLSFTDADPNGTSADYAATVDWGDGTTSAGVVGGAAGGFTVSGTHTYAQYSPAGKPYTITVTVVDTNGVPGNQANASRARVVGTTTAVVGDAPLSTQGVTFQAIEGTSVAGKVATFTDTSPLGVLTDLGASIDWGDGSPPDTSATIIQPGGPGTPYAVYGVHTYHEDATGLPIRVTISDLGGALAVANSTAVVADAAISALGTPVAALEGAVFSGPVAQVIDSNAGALTSDYRVTVDWGDGTTSDYPAGTPGLIARVDGPAIQATFDVLASHTYAQDGTYNVKVTVTDIGGADPAVASSVATVADAPLSAAVTQPTVSLMEGASSSTVALADFIDANPGAQPGDFLATIDWGDGTPLEASGANIVPDKKGGFLVQGSHSYATSGNFVVRVTVVDATAPHGGAGVASTVTIGNTAHVVDEPVTPAPVPVAATEGQPYSGMVATFSDPDPAALPADYTALIDWGDGTTSAGTVTQPDPTVPTFVVTGTHLYKAEGTYATSITVLDSDDGAAGPGPPPTPAIGSAFVADAPLLPSTPPAPAIQTYAGLQYQGVVASFFNSNTLDTDATYTALIDWGDGITSAGTITPDGQGNDAVLGSHAYSAPGSYTIRVTAAESDAASSIILTNTATITDIPPSATPLTFHPVEGQPFAGNVALFTDGDPTATSADLLVTIDWGDGTPPTSGTAQLVSVGPAGASFAIVGTHTYAQEGLYAFNPLTSTGGVTVTTVDTRNFAGNPESAPSSDTAVSTAIVGDAPFLAGPVSFANDATSGGPITEGQPFTADVAKFTDTNPAATLGDFAATIVWGDETTSQGTIVHMSGDPSTVFTVVGTHTYPNHGNMPVTVLVSDSGGATVTVNSTGVVADAPLTSQGMTIVSLEGANYGGPVASFQDANPSTDSSQYTVTINWGDGTSSPALFLLPDGTAFDVYATHTYKEEGVYTATVTVTDSPGGQPDPSAAITQAATTIVVLDAPLTAAAANPITTTEGTSSGTVTLASFTDIDSYGALGDYAATINWGDGITTYGTVVNSSTPGVFLVQGQHTYTKPGTFMATASITDTDGTGGTTAVPRAVATSPGVVATVIDAPLTAAPVAPLALSEGTTSGTVALATFTDADSNSIPADFIATVNWGDGTATLGAVVATGPGRFAIQGAHAYAEAGQYAIVVAVLDIDGQGSPSVVRSSASAVSVANVADAPLTAGPGLALASTEGASTGLLTVGTFIDADLGALPGDYYGTIDWGDGSTSPASFARAGSDGTTFNVIGSHVYPEQGVYTVRAYVGDTEGAPVVAGGYPVAGRANVTLVATMTVADAPLTTAAASLALSAVEGLPFSNVPVAIFRDANPLAAAQDYRATIDWGDGSSSIGNVQTGLGVFNVLGSHTYAEYGSYTVTVTIDDTDAASTAGSSLTTNSAVVSVIDAPLVAAGSTFTVAALAGATTGDAVVGSFTDTDPGGLPADDSGTIDWGDGTITPIGSITSIQGTTFAVHGAHTYAAPGLFAITVTVNDTDGGATSLTSLTLASATAVVAAPPITAPTAEGGLLNGYNSQLLSSVVTATFPAGSLTRLIGSKVAAIDWGDQQTSPGTIVMQQDGTCQIVGTHSYRKPGNYQVESVIVTPNGDTLTAAGTATIVDAPLTAAPVAVASTEGQTFQGAVSSFVDADPFGAIGDFTATIDWGDGISSNGTIAASTGGGFIVSGSHVYAEEGSYNVAVRVNDSGGSSISTATTATVADAPLAAEPTTPIGAMEGDVIDATLASFSDGNPGALAGDFTVVIDWGDGSTSTGLIVQPGGAGTPFEVRGSHVYANPGAYQAVATIVDTDGGPPNSGRSTLTAPATPVAIAPMIMNQSPAPGASGIGVFAPVSVAFRVPVQPSSVHITVTGPTGPVTGSLVYSTTTSTATFYPANPLGFSTTYTVAVNGATNSNGHVVSPVSWSFTTADSQSGTTLWPLSATPAITSVNDLRAVELGVKFSSDTAGYITGIDFYKGNLNTGTHVAHLWTITGTLLASATFTNESPTGWQEVTFARPIPIAANTTYVASYFAPNGGYADDYGDFTSSVDSGPLHAPSDASAGGNGVYVYGASGGFPTSRYQASNYWVTPNFVASASSAPPVSIASTSPAAATSAVALDTTVSATFSATVLTGSLTATLIGPGGSVPAAATYDDATHTVTLTPAAPLTQGTTYTVLVSGANDSSGDVLVGATWTFTTIHVVAASLPSDFGTGTFSNSVVSDPTSGGISFPSGLRDDFSGSTLSSAWSETAWSPAATDSIAGGVLSLAANEIIARSLVASDTGIAGRISFSNVYQHFGMATDLAAYAGNSWAIFSTMGTTNTLFARVNINGATQDVNLGPLPTGFHTYKILPVAGGFAFYVDGSLETTIQAALPAGIHLYPVLSDFNGSSRAPLKADSVQVFGGTYVSSAFDAGQTVNWLSGSWTATLPSGTSVIVETSTSTDGVNWSTWATVSNGGSVASPSGRYFRYRVILLSSDSVTSPVLSNITFTWA